MTKKFVYRTYKTQGDADSVLKKLCTVLLESGFVRTGEAGGILFFRYPSVRFSSKKPLTCVSRLSLEVTELNGSSLVKTGVTFTKIKYFTIFIMLLLCAVLPAVLGYIQHGVPDIPPMSFLGIPLGFMVHYHVRGRVFRALGRLIENL